MLTFIMVEDGIEIVSRNAVSFLQYYGASNPKELQHPTAHSVLYKPD